MGPVTARPPSLLRVLCRPVLSSDTLPPSAETSSSGTPSLDLTTSTPTFTLFAERPPLNMSGCTTMRSCSHGSSLESSTVASFYRCSISCLKRPRLAPHFCH
ncbi:hypothetical protein ACFX2H_022371 [Malus domestica]